MSFTSSNFLESRESEGHAVPKALDPKLNTGDHHV